MHDASVTSLFFHQQPGDNLTVPGPKSKHKPERDLVGIDTQTNRLVFLASASDFEGELALPRSLLKKHTHIKLYSNLIDSHIYVLRNWVIKYLNSQPNFSTIKGELLPHIVKKQLSKPPKNLKGSQLRANAIARTFLITRKRTTTVSKLEKRRLTVTTVAILSQFTTAIAFVVTPYSPLKITSELD
jgi:hypothetical protein